MFVKQEVLTGVAGQAVLGVAAWAPARRELRFALARGSGAPERRGGAQNAQEARPQARRSTAWTRRAVWQRGSEHAGVNAMAVRGAVAFAQFAESGLERLRARGSRN